MTVRCPSNEARQCRAVALRLEHHYAEKKNGAGHDRDHTDRAVKALTTWNVRDVSTAMSRERNALNPKQRG